MRYKNVKTSTSHHKINVDDVILSLATTVHCNRYSSTDTHRLHTCRFSALAVFHRHQSSSTLFVAARLRWLKVRFDQPATGRQTPPENEENDAAQFSKWRFKHVLHLKVMVFVMRVGNENRHSNAYLLKVVYSLVFNCTDIRRKFTTIWPIILLYKSTEIKFKTNQFV